MVHFMSFFPLTAMFQVSPLETWAIMNLTASSYWLNNYFGEAMDNVIQDSKGKNENLWESNKPNDLFCW